MKNIIPTDVQKRYDTFIDEFTSDYLSDAYKLIALGQIEEYFLRMWESETITSEAYFEFARIWRSMVDSVYQQIERTCNITATVLEGIEY